MSRIQFVSYARRYGVRSAAWLACQLGVSLALVQLWLRSLLLEVIMSFDTFVRDRAAAVGNLLLQLDTTMAAAAAAHFDVDVEFGFHPDFDLA